MDAHYRLSGNMELEVETDGVSVDSALETFNDIETGAFENERCGICMDIIIDRGVIDCCQDWFCFSCIDNWATITNLCPLCQNEFQLITCVPVYDTIGSAKVDDDSISRHDDWFIQGKNNTLSFPSYYIDENAVICLDEDCKIRNGTATLEDDPNLDTSIACDSCDKWYHAFCVGFDPESTLENSWLCPRCVIEEASQNSDGVSIKVPSTQIDPEAASQECTIVDALSRKLSVSIADAGETAVVISLIEGKHRVQEATENVPLAVDYRDKKTLDRKNDIQPNVNLNETSLASSSWKDSHITLSKDNSLLHGELKTNSYENDPADLLSNIPNIESEPSEYESNVDPHLAFYVGPSLSVDRSSSIETENHNSDGSKISADVLSNIHNIETDLSEKEANTDPQLGFFMGSSLLVDKSNTETENDNSRVSQMHHPSKELSLSVEKMMTEAIEDTVGFSSVQRKLRKFRGRTLTTEDTKHDNGYASHKMAVEVTAKKAKVHTESEQPPLTLGTRNFLSRGISKHKCLPDDSSKLNDIQEKEDETSDIMNIVVREHALTTEDTKHDHSYASHKMVVKVPAKKAKVHRESEQPPSNHGTRNSSSRGISMHKCLPDDSSKLNDVQEKEDETSDIMNIVVRDHALTTEDTKHDHSYASHKMVVEVPAKKAKVNRESEQPPSKHGTRNSSSRSISKQNRLPDASSKLNDVQEKENGTSDIMNIVRGIDHRPSHVTFSNNGNGLRVKKIMRRAVENESSEIVEKLRKEIREAVRNKAAKNFSKDEPFNPKLLIAFRAAIAGPRAEQEPVKKLNPSVLRSKKSMLQKGKIRENLTKKIYATNNGRRRRAWDRDWEIEFWKRRCVRASKAEKIDTLKSVLDLLNKSSVMDQELEADRANPILSRLYLADTSLFPRKDDVKPLSALTSTGSDAVTTEHNLKGKVSTPINDDTNVCPATQTTETSSRASFITSTNIQLNHSTIKKTSIPSGSNMDVQQQKEMPDKSDVKSDKRKWALEVLARKTAAVGQATHGKQEDTSLPKEKYPLLAQIPPDMRPTVAPSPHNKVPISVRQAQLCRLTEHFLRKTNLPVIRRTADTELAVADAINIEKEVADRSNGKIVYLNLCSQVLSQHMNNNRPDSTAESNPSLGFPAESTELEVNTLSSNLSAEEALKMAGLVSDSPPSSPLVEALNVEDDPPESSREDTPDNVFDMDTHGDVDIYGDFEYDLEDESYIGGNVLKVKSPLEEGDLRMKLVFSTIKTDKTDNVPNLEDEERLGIVKAPIDTPCLELHKGGGIECSTFNDGTNTSSPKHDPLQGKTDEEQHLAECEELYGPNKEEITVMYPDEASVLPNSSIGRDAPAETLASVEHGCYMPDKEAGSTLEESCTESISAKSRLPANHHSFGRENSPNHSLNENLRKDKRPSKLKQSDTGCSVFEKVEAYIKEHIRPLCKSGVITVDQYRWAVRKTSEKIMRYHSKDQNANFLIKEGDKVKKLAEQYVEAAQQMP